MPRNTTGGSGHKGRANGEGKTHKKNSSLVEAYLDDIRSEGKCEGVECGRITRKMGDGRMEVFYVYDVTDEEGKAAKRGAVVIALIKGGLRGRGKSQVYIDVGTIVLLDTGLNKTIIGALNDDQKDELNRIKPLDPRILAKEIVDQEALKKEMVEQSGGFVFEEEKKGELNINAI